MDIKLNIDPADIQREVTDAIVKSAFGENLKKAVDGALKRMNDGWFNNELEKVVEREMRGIISKTVEEKYTEQIKLQLIQKITPDVLASTVDKVTTKVLSAMGAERY